MSIRRPGVDRRYVRDEASGTARVCPCPGLPGSSRSAQVRGGSPMAVLVPRETPRTWKLQEVLVTEPGVIRRAIAAAAIGNVTEWYDFGVYAYFEPTIRKVFFAG